MIYFWLAVQFICGFIGGYMFAELGLRIKDKNIKITIGVVFGLAFLLGTDGGNISGQEEYN